MTQREFKRQLRRGLGSAIVELRSTADVSKYIETIRWCCLHDITYDWQVEGTRGGYLYEAVCLSGDMDGIEKDVIAAYLKSNKDNLNFQLSEILIGFALDGSSCAREALWQKYEMFADKNGRLSKQGWVDEGLQWEDLTLRLVRLDGIKAFNRYVNDVGSLMRTGKNTDKVYYDWFIDSAKNQLGKKRLGKHMEKLCKTSPDAKMLIDIINGEQENSAPYEKRESIHLDDYYEKTIEASIKKNPRYGLFIFAYRFANQSSIEEQIALTKLYLNENDPVIRALLLLPFIKTNFPLEIEPIINDALGTNQLLSEIAIQVLERFKSTPVHDLARRLLQEKGLDSGALSLFNLNYNKPDEALIRPLILTQHNTSHPVQMDVRDIYNRHRSKTCADTLYHIYKNGECAFCRLGTVKAMHKNGVLSDTVLSECLYDSYEDTRVWAQRLSRRKGLV